MSHFNQFFMLFDHMGAYRKRFKYGLEAIILQAKGKKLYVTNFLLSVDENYIKQEGPAPVCKAARFGWG